MIEYQSFWFKISSITKPWAVNSFTIKSFLSLMIPEVMNFPPGFKHSLACGISGTMISAKMLATIKSTFLLIPSSKLFVPILISFATGFNATFSFVALIASSSISYASISPAPRYFAAILKTPGTSTNIDH